MKYASFFSGCGGLDLGINGGFKYLGKEYPANGFEQVFANDIDNKACKTYIANFKHPIVNKSIHNIDFSSIQADLVVGGFPCQPFSYAGKRLGESDERGKLYLSMIEAIKIIAPKAFLMENVKGLIDIDGGQTLKTILKTVSDIGYNVNYKLYEAKNYGIPQNRSRIFIIGLRRDVFGSSCFQHPAGIDKLVATYEALADLEHLKEGEMPNHFYSKAKRNKGQGNKAIDRHDVSPAIRAEHHGNIEFHYSDERRLSAREAARLQSFPDDFVFYDSTSDAYRQIGNAVPPVLGWHVGKEIAKHLSKFDDSIRTI